MVALLLWRSALIVRSGGCACGDNSSMATVELNPALRRLSSVSLLTLIVLCVAWELRMGAPWLAFKAVPLGLALRGIVRGHLYTYQWAAMLVLLYVMEGAVRAVSDLSRTSALLGLLELVLAVLFFGCAIFYVRPAKQAARRAKRSGQ